MTGRREFLAGVGSVLLLPRPAVPRRFPVRAVLTGPGGRSAPIEFDGRRPVSRFQFGTQVPVPPLDFVAPRAGTWTHVELSAGARVQVHELTTATAVWADDRVRVVGVTWSGS